MKVKPISKPFLLFSMIILALLVLVGCGLQNEPAASAPALLPELGGYHTIEGQSFTDALTTLGVMATLAGQPELGAPIATVSSVVGCYQDAGAVSARVYSKQEDPVHSGVVAVGDRDALLNPITFLQCIPGRGNGRAPESAGIEPCSHSYTLAKDGNEFYILYAGLTPEICQTFCDNLEGCTAQ